MCEIKRRLNRTKKIDNENFKVKFGTTNALTPTTVYIEANTFVTPSEKSEKFSDDINEMKTALKNSINHELFRSSIYDPRYILDFDLPLNSLKVGKKSFLSFQLTIKQKDKLNLCEFKTLQEAISPFVDNIIGALSDCLILHGYSMSKKKK